MMSAKRGVVVRIAGRWRLPGEPILMKRREFLKSATAVTALSTTQAAAVAGGSEPRQVVFVLGESVRRDMLNCYRHTGLKTPSTTVVDK